MSDTFLCGGCQTEISFHLPDFSDHYFNLCSGEILHQCQIADCMQLFAGREDLYKHGIEEHLGTIFYEETYVILNEEIADSFCRENLISSTEQPRNIDPKFYCDDFENLIDNLAEKPKKNSKSVRYKMNVICKVCGKKISHTSMEKHFRNCNNKDKPHECSHEGCGATFTTKDHKHRHEISVHRSPVRCPFESCQKLVKPAGLNSHIKRSHMSRSSTEDMVKVQPAYEEYNEVKPFVEPIQKIIPKVEANGHIDGIKLEVDTEQKISFDTGVDEIKLEVETDQQVSYEDQFEEIEQRTTKSKNPRRPKKNTFFCPYENCGAIFDKKVEWANHMKHVHQAPVSCPYENCSSLVKPANLGRHIRGTHEKIKKQCERCEKWLSIYCIRAHQKYCRGIAGRNSEAPKNTENTDEQISHQAVDDSTSATMKIEPDVAKVENEPKAKAQNKNKRSKKVETETKVPGTPYLGDNYGLDEGPVACSYEGCGIIFGTIEERYEHYNVIHLNRVKCTYENCNAFVKQSCLSAHIKARHEKVKKQCTNCQKWTSIYSFYAHYERCTSNGEKKYRCTFEGCDATFTTSANRFSHVSITHRRLKGSQDAVSDDKPSNVP